MNKNIYLNLCIIGAGRLGTTISYTLAKRNVPGIRLKAIASRSSESLNRAKKILGSRAAGIDFTRENLRAAAMANCILICTPDDSISSVCGEIFGDSNRDYKNYYAIHFSGSKSLKALDSAAGAGAETASIHPLKSFASIQEAIKTLKGTVFGITCSGIKSKKASKLLVEKLGGLSIEVEDDKKPLYHAAACVASNYLVSLINYAVVIHRKIGIKPEDSLKGLMGLIAGTIGNIKKMGTEKSLTGPIARGDIGTIKEHMDNFNKYFTEKDVKLYRSMGAETSRVAYGNKWISKSTMEKLKKILEE